MDNLLTLLFFPLITKVGGFLNMIKIDSVSKYYQMQIRALNKVTLNIYKGEIVGLLGPNGAGKTTLIKIICGLVLPDEGTVEVCGNPLNTRNKYRIIKDIGVVLEGVRNLYWKISAKDNFFYFGALKGKTKSEIKQNIEKYVHVLDIRELLHRKVGSLSLGQKQRVAITAALLHEPQIIILDEPSNGLDLESRSMLIKGIKHIKNSLGMTVLITSHDLDFLRKIVDRFVVLNDGEVVESFMNYSDYTNDYLENRYKECIGLREAK